MLIPNYTEDFLTFKPELQSFIFRLLANKQDTEDIIQDTYLKVHENIHTFKNKSSFKTWVFSIALNIGRNYLKKQNRWVENAQDYGASLHAEDKNHWQKMRDVFAQTPEKKYEIKEHIVYCFNCINKTLEADQQVCLLLKDVYAFKVSEIMEITNLSEGKVKHAIANARKNMIRIFDNRCSFVNKQGVCHQCSVLKGNLNPEHDVQVEAVKLKMVKEGNNPDKEYLLNLRLQLVKDINPLEAPNSVLNVFMLENLSNWVKEAKDKGLLKKDTDTVVSGCKL